MRFVAKAGGASGLQGAGGRDRGPREHILCGRRRLEQVQGGFDQLRRPLINDRPEPPKDFLEFQKRHRLMSSSVSVSACAALGVLV